MYYLGGGRGKRKDKITSLEQTATYRVKEKI